MPRSLERSSRTSRSDAETAPAPAMRVSPRSHSFFRYAALQDPAHAGVIQRVLSMPSKRYDRKLIGFLTRDEIDALLRAPDRRSWSGRRHHALLLLAVQTGLRVSELTGLRRQDVVLGVGAHVRCQGKGRKERCTPLRRETATTLREWLRESPPDPTAPLFPSARRRAMSRDGVQYLIAKYVVVASQWCPSLAKKRVSPHVLRHSTAMESPSPRRRPLRHRLVVGP